MPDYPDLPWPKINDYLMEVAAARNLNQLLRLALFKIGALIPFDHAGILGLIDIPGHVTYQETCGGSASCYRDFQKHYCRVMPDVGQSVVKSAATDWYEYNRTEYVTDFVRPHHFRYTAGIGQFFRNDCGNLSISINRSPDLPPFNEIEIQILEIIQGHLANFCAMLNPADPGTSWPDCLDLRSVYPMLTPREAEVAALLCRKYSAGFIASRLMISPLTIYKHIENIYAKLNVNCRKDLRAKLLGQNVRLEEIHG